ncbi:MAG: lysine--tRNA ligase [Candidatus Paceibacterota bacterium]|jgi:lysyl-tRNA synthetase class 2
MASIEEIRDERIKKLANLRKAGMDPYPVSSDVTHTADQVLSSFDKLAVSGEKVSVGGRIMAVRGHGAVSFVDIDDGTAKIQALFKKDIVGEEKFKLFADNVDIGDFIQLSGKMFATQRDEKTLEVADWNMLAKSLRPLPDKWHGLQDVDERYRRRYLDLLMNKDLRDLIVKKSKFWDVTRNFFKERGFLEVETPTLELTTGGAEARPCKTHHNDFDLEMYLRISVGELWQKRLIAAGFPKTFEIGRVYRNEGTSPEHLQEFTNMEFYWGYADYKDGMKLVKELYRSIAEKVFGTTKFEHNGHSFDLASEWKEIDYIGEIKEQTGVNIEKANEQEIKDKLKELGVVYQGENKERLVDTLWKYCRKNISGPAFLVNHPVLVAPLAKRVPGEDAANPTMNRVEMFQPLIAGSEVGRGYSELNDPVDQKERFEAQQKLIEGGDEEAMMPDYEFVEMLEHGMPPTCGFGFGERLFAILAGRPARELQTFPLVRPKEE